MKSRYEAQTITVNNNFSPPAFLPWVVAFCNASDASITIYDSRKRIIHYNNLFGTLDEATPDDLLDLYSVFAYYGRFYENWQDCQNMVVSVFLTGRPAQFIMLNSTGGGCSCVAYPVIDGGKLGGVVLLAHRIYGSTIQSGSSQRQQPSCSAPRKHKYVDFCRRNIARIANNSAATLFLSIAACGGY